MDIKKTLEDAKAAVQEGRLVLLKHFKNLEKVREKHRAGLVSEADIESEEVITTYLKSCFPKIPILGEESSYSLGKLELPGPTFWVLDPLDGTTNYVHGFHIFCISLGLVVDGALKLGVIDVPLLKQTYWGIAGGGAFRDGRRLHVSQTEALQQSLLATGLPDDRDLVKEQLQIFANLLPQVRGVRRAGAAAYDLCMVAEGIFDAFWEKNLKPWDTAAGVLLVREAGGRAVNYKGEEFRLEHDSLLATNHNLHSQVFAQIQQSL